MQIPALSSGFFDSNSQFFLWASINFLHFAVLGGKSLHFAEPDKIVRCPIASGRKSAGTSGWPTGIPRSSDDG
jgi:hypothetical protein